LPRNFISRLTDDGNGLLLALAQLAEEPATIHGPPAFRALDFVFFQNQPYVVLRFGENVDGLRRCGASLHLRIFRYL
jgi:hypothetical protein